MSPADIALVFEALAAGLSTAAGYLRDAQEEKAPVAAPAPRPVVPVAERVAALVASVPAPATTPTHAQTATRATTTRARPTNGDATRAPAPVADQPLARAAPVETTATTATRARTTDARSPAPATTTRAPTPTARPLIDTTRRGGCIEHVLAMLASGPKHLNALTEGTTSSRNAVEVCCCTLVKRGRIVRTDYACTFALPLPPVEAPAPEPAATAPTAASAAPPVAASAPVAVRPAAQSRGWTAEDDAELRRLARDNDCRVVAKTMARSWQSVAFRSGHLGVLFKRDRLHLAAGSRALDPDKRDVVDFEAQSTALCGLTDEDVSARFACVRRKREVSEATCIDCFLDAHKHGHKATAEDKRGIAWGCGQGAALRLRYAFELEPTPRRVAALLVHATKWQGSAEWNAACRELGLDPVTEGAQATDEDFAALAIAHGPDSQ